MKKFEVEKVLGKRYYKNEMSELGLWKEEGNRKRPVKPGGGPGLEGKSKDELKMLWSGMVER